MNAGLKATFPLWHRDRMDNVYEIVNLGYQCVIKSLCNTLLPRTLLGRVIDSAVIDEMKNYGVDICGENGEYHTLVTDGPVFNRPLEFRTGEILDFDEFSIITMQLI